MLLSLVFLSEVRFSLKIHSKLKSLIQTLFSSFQLLFDSNVSNKILPSFSRFCFQSPNEFFYFVALSLQKMCCFVKNSVNIFFLLMSIKYLKHRWTIFCYVMLFVFVSSCNYDKIIFHTLSSILCYWFCTIFKLRGSFN